MASHAQCAMRSVLCVKQFQAVCSAQQRAMHCAFDLTRIHPHKGTSGPDTGQGGLGGQGESAEGTQAHHGKVTPGPLGILCWSTHRQRPPYPPSLPRPSLIHPRGDGPRPTQLDTRQQAR